MVVETGVRANQRHGPAEEAYEWVRAVLGAAMALAAIPYERDQIK